MSGRRTGTQLVFWSGLLLWPIAHPGIAVSMACAVAALAGLSAIRIRPNASIEAMFARDNPSAAALARVLNDFPAADQLLLLASLPDDTPVADPQRLAAFGQRFVDAARRDPDLGQLTDGVFYRVDPEMRGYFEKVVGPAAIFYLDEAQYEAATVRLTPDEIRRQIAQGKALLAIPGPAAQGFAKLMRQDPLGLHELIADRLAGQTPLRTYDNGDVLVSPDGRSLLVRILGKQPPNDLDFCKALTEGVARVAQGVNRDGLRLEYAGSYAIAATSARSIRRDMIASVIGSIALLQVLFLLAYRSPFKLFAMSFGPVALGILLGFGAYGLISTGLTPLTGVLGAILAGMGIDYSIQYISYYEGRRVAGDSRRRAAERSAMEMSPAVLAAWATSVIGFLAIGWSHVKALRDFAVLGTLGLTGAFLCAVLLLPTVLMMTDGRPTPIARGRIRFGAAGLVKALGSRSMIWLGLAVLAMVAAAGVVARSNGDVLPSESDLTVMHPRPNAAIEAQSHVSERFGAAPGSLAVYLHADSPDRLVELAYDLERRLKSKAGRSTGITGTYGLATLLPDPRLVPARRAGPSEAQADRVVADFRSALADNGFAPEAFSDYAKFLHLLLTRESAPTIGDLLSYRRMAETVLPAAAFRGVTPNEAITLVFFSRSLDRDRGARDETIAAVREALQGLDGATITGLGVVSYDTEQTVRRELPRLILAAVAIVAIYLALHFRSLAAALLSLLPAVFGMLVAAAALRLAGQKLNMVNLVAVPLLIGIDVDYGIFLVTLARVRRVRHETTEELATRIDPVCHAVIMCAVATMLGYLSLIWTSVPAERSLGIAAATGVGACLAGVLFLLVPVFSRRCLKT